LRISDCGLGCAWRAPGSINPQSAIGNPQCTSRGEWI